MLLGFIGTAGVGRGSRVFLTGTKAAVKNLGELFHGEVLATLALLPR